MLLDAAKGLEPQTMKLFDVCRHRGIPVLTVVNKWDRPGLEALELMDEIRERTGLEPTPLTWPVGIAGDFRGVLDRSTGDFVRFTRTAGGATIAPRSTSRPPRPPPGGRGLAHGVEESELLEAMGQVHDQASFLSGVTTPVLFGSRC
jgi:peptide chain release factor 3